MIRFRPSAHRIGAVFVMLACAPGAASTQPAGTLAGHVLDETTMTGVPQARLSLGGAGATTDAQGAFLLEQVPAGPASVRVEAPGYAASVEDVEVAADEVVWVRLHVRPLAAVLDELLVTARADGEPRAQGFSGSRIGGAGDGTAQTALDLLALQVPGLMVASNDGTLSARGRIRIRGGSTATQSNDPVIVLDGVRIAGGGMLGASDRALQLLNEVPAAQVARIRVLKGAAAASLYGDAANGIILIETRAPR